MNQLSTILFVALYIKGADAIVLDLNQAEVQQQSSFDNWLPNTDIKENQPVSHLRGVEFEDMAHPVMGQNGFDFLDDYQRTFCKLTPIVHLLHMRGCHSKAIASFACSGSCSSHVQYERSCSCCQQTSLREATLSLDCPSLDPPYRKVKTFAPVDCICRACTDLGKEEIHPQELMDISKTRES